jgi:hypothetical protein
LTTKLPKLASNKVDSTLSNQKRHFSINIDATVLAVVPSLTHFDAACSDVLWLGQRLMVDDEIAQNGLQQGSFHLIKLKSPFLHQYQCCSACCGTILEPF